MDSSTPSQTEQYQPLTSPQFKSAKCFAGKKILISKEANTVLQSLSGINKSKLNNQMSCIATSNIGTIGNHKLYIELIGGLLEFVVSRKANRTETMIEQVRYLKGLRQPWTGQYIQLSNHQVKKDGRKWFDTFSTKPVFSFPDESLKDFLVRTAPLFVRLTNSNHEVGSTSFRSKAEFASAIYLSKGNTTQYALILESQGLPHLSVAISDPPIGFKTKTNPSGGNKRVRETVHTHGNMSIRMRELEQQVEGILHFYGGSEKEQEELKFIYVDQYVGRSRGLRGSVKGDMDDFSDLDYNVPGWLVTDKVCVKYQRGQGTAKKIGCYQ